MTDRPTAIEIIEACTEHEKHTSELRTRMEDDYGLARLEAYAVDAKKGEYESATTNSPAVLVGKVVEYLADGELKFTVPIQDKDTEGKRGDEAARAKGNMNELFVYALNELAEQHWQAYPENPALLGAKAFYSTVRGWLAERVLLWQDGDDIIPDVAEWDPRNTYWGSGGKGLKWACYIRYATQGEVEDLYNVKVEVDSRGRVKLYDYWNDTYEIIASSVATAKSSESSILYTNEHKLGYVPVYIKPVGATPLVQSSKYSDTNKDVGESVMVYDRSIFPLENRMLSYYLQTVEMGVQLPKVLWVKGGAARDNPFDADPYRKGGVIVLSEDQYSKIEDFVKPLMPQDAAAFMNLLISYKNIGGLPPISWGEIGQAQTAQGLNMLNHNAMTILKPRKKAIELSYDWEANEFIHQYINGGFQEMEIGGLDARQKQYSVKVSPDQLDPKRRVKTTLMLNLPMDEFQNVGIVTTLVKEGMMSRRLGMDRYLHIQDTDAEEAQIFMEKIKQIPEVQLPVVAAKLILDGQVDYAKSVLAYMQRQGQLEQQGAPGGGASPVGFGTPTPRGAPNIPKEIMERARMARLGLTRG